MSYRCHCTGFDSRSGAAGTRCCHKARHGCWLPQNRDGDRPLGQCGVALSTACPQLVGRKSWVFTEEFGWRAGCDGSSFGVRGRESVAERLGDERLEILRRWGQGLSVSGRDEEMRAAGRAIVLLVEEIGGFQRDLWH